MPTVAPLTSAVATMPRFPSRDAPRPRSTRSRARCSDSDGDTRAFSASSRLMNTFGRSVSRSDVPGAPGNAFTIQSPSSSHARTKSLSRPGVTVHVPVGPNLGHSTILQHVVVRTPRGVTERRRSTPATRSPKLFVSASSRLPRGRQAWRTSARRRRARARRARRSAPATGQPHGRPGRAVSADAVPMTATLLRQPLIEL